MLPVPCDNDAYQKTMGCAIARLRENSIEHVVFGDLFLEDIRQYRVDQMLGTGIAPLFPLWLKNTAELSRKMVDEGLRAIITTVDLRVLPIEFVGRQYDHDFLNDLPDGVDPCGENGEFHTVAIAGPMFSEEIEVEIGERYVSGDFAYIDVIPTKDMTR